MSDKTQRGGINVETQHIFPVIKKWLYSEKDIFLREIVSNASDAITKLKRLNSLGHVDLSDEEINAFRIDVILDKDAGTLSVKDNGIGMSEEELTKYLCNIALSGALDFIAKYEGENENESGIIGHFGLGFYSSFMVSDKVEVVTRSHKGDPALRWVCTESGEYEIFPSDCEETGTTVTMYISDSEKEYLDSNKIRSILDKYCSFMPVPIFFNDGSDKKEEEVEEAINDTTPLWQKQPADCTEEEYNAFYKKVFADFRDPLFSIHINADYPLNFKGILYFPRIENEYQSLEGQVKLYYNQVFVADNIKEVIPEYLLMLKGVLDCPELPLNVSRSYLQTNTYVSRVSAHIVKKVADKLNSLCNSDREKYEKVFDSIKTFIEYACIRDRKFYDRVKDSILFPLSDGSHKSVSECLAASKEAGFEGKLFYASDKALQGQYIELVEKKNLPVLFLPHVIDTQFISTLEGYEPNAKFFRVDSNTEELFSSKDASGEECTKIAQLFKKAAGNENLEVRFASVEGSDIPAILGVSEESRRFSEMMKMYSGADSPDMPVESSLTVNTASPIYERLSKENSEELVSYVYKLALLANRKLSAKEMNEFIGESISILKKL